MSILSGNLCMLFCYSLFMDQVGGTEQDVYGVRKKKWSWMDWKQNHVHAPPIQPITYAITPRVGLRIMSQENITLTLTCRSRSVRFHVGTRLKVGMHHVTFLVVFLFFFFLVLSLYTVKYNLGVV